MKLIFLPDQINSELYYQSFVFSRKNYGNEREIALSNSYGSFIEFWGAVKNVSAIPVFSVTAKGYLLAEWYNSETENFVVMFSGDSAIHYSLKDEDEFSEGVILDFGKIDNIINMMNAREKNPWLWSDA